MTSKTLSEPTSYVVEGNTYRELIAQRDAYKRVANDLARQLRERTPADTNEPPERATSGGEAPPERTLMPDLAEAIKSGVPKQLRAGNETSGVQS